MERNQRDRSGEFNQNQRDKLQGAGKGTPEQDRTRRGSEQQKQGGGQQGGSQQGGSQGFERDMPRRSEEQDFDIDRQSGVPGRGSEKGPGQTGSPRQPGVGERGQTGTPGRRSS
jgi:hypothetical protein